MHFRPVPPRQGSPGSQHTHLREGEGLQQQLQALPRQQHPRHLGASHHMHLPALPQLQERERQRQRQWQAARASAGQGSGKE